MQPTKLVKFTKFFLDFMFYCGILVTLTVPITFRVLGVYYPNIGSHYIVMCIIFYAQWRICTLDYLLPAPHF